MIASFPETVKFVITDCFQKVRGGQYPEFYSQFSHNQNNLPCLRPVFLCLKMGVRLGKTNLCENEVGDLYFFCNENNAYRFFFFSAKI